MGKAVSTNIEYVKSCCQGGTFKSVWDRLCEQLFGTMPKGMNGEEQLPDIDIWKEGVALLDDSDPYSFTVYGEETPKTGDIIEYKGKFYIIGTVVPNN